jgi:hypothetical protein
MWFAAAYEGYSSTSSRTSLLFGLPTRKRCSPSACGPLSPAGRSGTLRNLTHPTHGGLKGFVIHIPADHRQARAIASVREFTLMVQLPFSAVIWPGGMVVAK